MAYGSYLSDNLFGRGPWNLKFRPAEGISSPNATGIGASHRGLWVTYTVPVQKTGDYRVTAFVARPDAMRACAEKPDRMMLEADDQRSQRSRTNRGRIRCLPCGGSAWYANDHGPRRRSAGR